MTGLIISNLLVFGSICKLMTKSLHRQIDSRSTWDCKVNLECDARKELEFWFKSVPKLNCRPLLIKPTLATRVVYSDASNTGCAAFISASNTPIYYKNWNNLELNQSSTWRELKCIRDAFNSFIPILYNNNIKWFTDNQAVVTIVNSGSMNLELHKLAVDIFFAARHNNIEMNIEWIPRTLNERADYLSKIVDFDDWQVDDQYFQALQSRWGLCTIDCFASCENYKISRFYSKYFNPNSLGVDCFSFDWAGEFCWLVPPIKLVPKAIKHVCTSGCRAILTVPFWPSAVFWPFLINNDGFFRKFVLDFVYVENGKAVFVHGANKESLFGSDKFNSPVLFLLLDGRLGASINNVQ